MKQVAHKPKLFILDRDGVINKDSDKYIKSVDEFHIYKTSLDAIAIINKANIPIAITTNQSGIFRGYYTESTLKQIHNKLHNSLKKHSNSTINKILYCPHGPNENCSCRKPKPTMLLESLKEFNVDANNAVFVGDSLSDLKSAKAAHIPCVLVRTGKGLRTIKTLQTNHEFYEFSSVPVFNNLLSFVKSLNLLS